MRILSLRPEPRGSGSIVAFLDAQVADDVRMFDLALRRTPNGYSVYPPKNRRNCASATFAPALAAALCELAVTAYLQTNERGSRPDDNNAHAA